MAHRAPHNQGARSAGWKTVRMSLLAYAITCLLAGCFSAKLIYHPHPISTEEALAKAKAADMERWVDPAGRQVGLKRLAYGGNPEGAVLFFHGNGGTASACAWYATMLQREARLDCYALEYPGYENIPGVPHRDALIAAAQAALDSLDERQPVYLVGESLGTGVAAALAGRNPRRIAGVMLLSPFRDLGDVAQDHFPWLPARWLLFDENFRSADYLRDYRGPVGMLVDGKDRIVPASSGRELYAGYAGPKRLWENPEGDHLQLDQDPGEFWKSVVAFWRSAAHTSAR